MHSLNEVLWEKVVSRVTKCKEKKKIWAVKRIFPINSDFLFQNYDIFSSYFDFLAPSFDFWSPHFDFLSEIYVILSPNHDCKLKILTFSPSHLDILFQNCDLLSQRNNFSLKIMTVYSQIWLFTQIVLTLFLIILTCFFPNFDNCPQILTYLKIVTVY